MAEIPNDYNSMEDKPRLPDLIDMMSYMVSHPDGMQAATRQYVEEVAQQVVELPHNIVPGEE